MGIYAVKVAKNLSNHYNQKLVDSAKKYTTDTIKTGSKRAIQKTAEVTDNLTGNKTTETTEFHSNETNNKTAKEAYISPKDRQETIDELSLT